MKESTQPPASDQPTTQQVYKPFRQWQNTTVVTAEKILDILPETADAPGERIIICGEGADAPRVVSHISFIWGAGLQPGNYLVKHPGGEVSVLPAGTFEESFSLVPDGPNEKEEQEILREAEITRLTEELAHQKEKNGVLFKENTDLNARITAAAAENVEIIKRLDAAIALKTPSVVPNSAPAPSEKPMEKDGTIVRTTKEADAWFRENSSGTVICEAPNGATFEANCFPDAEEFFELNPNA